MYIVTRWVYKIFGAKLSTNIAFSPIGKMLFKIITYNSTSGNKKKLNLYQTTHGLQLKLNLTEAQSLGIAYLGVINKVETDLLSRILKPGDVVLDVGAFVDGWYTLLAGKLVGNKGHVYSFEPHPDYYKRLCQNIALNKLKNVTAENVGLSHKVGRASFYEAAQGSSLIKEQAESSFEGKIKKITISTTTLDTYIKKKNIKNIRLVKIDIEGMEMNVLKTATSILTKKNAPDILLEVWESHLNKSGSSEKELINYLKKFGFIPYSFTSKGLVKYRLEDKRTMFNMFFSKRALGV